MVRIDRISNLPDSLLHHIMSFLQSQEAVQTCVLSKRWKNLWASLQCLHLDLDLSKFENINERFKNFINPFLLLRDTSDLHTFRLICVDYDADVNWPVMTWILYAIKRNAKVIEINADYERLPQCMFNSKTLELNLSTSCIDKGIWSRAINLPRLKKLELCVYSDGSDILNKLAQGCSALEDLYLNNCLMDICVVSFPKLKYLNISSRHESTWVKSIRAPNLVSLVLDGYAQNFKETSLEKMPSLMNATISLWRCYPFFVEKCNLLRAVANVQNLELSGSTIQGFSLKCQHKCCLKADQGSNSIKSALLQCKNLDEIEVELKGINAGTTELVNKLVESLSKLKKTHLILSFHSTTWFTSSSLTDLHQFCPSMVQGKNVLTVLSGNKFVVWSK